MSRRTQRTAHQRLVEARGGRLIAILKDGGRVVVLEDGHQRDAVVAVGDLATVVALPARVLERVEGDLLVLVQEDLQLPHRDAEVVLVELVRDVPPDGAELLALVDDGVEEGEAPEHLAELDVLLAAVEQLHVGYRVHHVRAQEAGCEALGGLVCDPAEGRATHWSAVARPRRMRDGQRSKRPKRSRGKRGREAEVGGPWTHLAPFSRMEMGNAGVG